MLRLRKLKNSLEQRVANVLMKLTKTLTPKFDLGVATITSGKQVSMQFMEKRGARLATT
jgi:hypothetical protein